MELNVSISNENMLQAIIELLADEPSRKIIADVLRKYYGDKVDESMVAMGFTPELPDESMVPEWAPVKGEWVTYPLYLPENAINFTGTYEHAKNGKSHVYRPAGPRAGQWYDCLPENLRPATNAEVAAVLDLQPGDELVLWRNRYQLNEITGRECEVISSKLDGQYVFVQIGTYKLWVDAYDIHLVSRTTKPEPDPVERLFKQGDVVEIKGDGNGRALLVKWSEAHPGEYVYLMNSDGSHFWELPHNLTLIRAAANTD